MKILAIETSTMLGTQSAGPTDPVELEAFLDAYLAEQMETHHIPGMVFTMVKDGEVFFSKGYGYADLEEQTPFDPEQTVLITASLPKAFAAVGVLQLNERGQIDLHDDVRPYFKDFPLKTNFDEPLTYQIRVKGHLCADWKDWFDGMTITLEDDGNALLTGPVIDQAALHGLLKKVRDLGMPLVSVGQVQFNKTHLQR